MFPRGLSKIWLKETLYKSTWVSIKFLKKVFKHFVIFFLFPLKLLKGWGFFRTSSAWSNLKFWGGESFIWGVCRHVSELSLDNFFVRNQEWFVCITCHKKYKHRTSVWRHIKFECNKKPQFKCHVCGKCVTQKATLKTHLENVHGLLYVSSRCRVWPSFYFITLFIFREKKVFFLLEFVVLIYERPSFFFFRKHVYSRSFQVG